MKVSKIHYTTNFNKLFRALPIDVQKRTLKTEELFRDNPFHPSLRLHKLKGKLAGRWSISIDRRNRIIFRPMEDGVIVFLSIGMHAIYQKD